MTGHESEQWLRVCEGMTLAQLHSAVVADDERSQQALWYLLYVRLAPALRRVWDDVQAAQPADPGKGYDDYVADFYLYLYEGRPMAAPAGHYYYLATVADNMRLEAWAKQTFRRFVIGEVRAREQHGRAVAGLAEEMAYERRSDVAIDMRRIACSIALLEAEETALGRYIFYRHVTRLVLDDCDVVRRPDDAAVAGLLGLSYGAYRVRSSRLCAKVSGWIQTLPAADVARLGQGQLSLVARLCSPEADLAEILVDLLMRTEALLPEAPAIERERREVSPSVMGDAAVLGSAFPTFMTSPGFGLGLVVDTARMVIRGAQAAWSHADEPEASAERASASPALGHSLFVARFKSALEA